MDGTSLSRFLGPTNMKAIAKGPLPLADGLHLRLETVKRSLMLSRRSVVIAYYADIKLLDAADGMRNAAGVVAVPRIPGEADGWAARRGARVHGDAPQPAATLIDDPVAERALDALGRAINPSTGLIHPSDKARADGTLRILRTNGHADPTSDIKSWAIREGWQPRHATDLEALSRRIWGLKGKLALSRITSAMRAGATEPDRTSGRPSPRRRCRAGATPAARQNAQTSSDQGLKFGALQG